MFGMSGNPDVLNILCSMKAVLFTVPVGASFLSCDQPVCLYHPDKNSPYGVGPASEKVEISLPLSSSALLFLTHEQGDDEQKFASFDDVDEFNRRTIVTADKYIFSSLIPDEVACVAYNLRDQSAGFRFDMLPAVGGFYQVHRYIPVYPA